jgi:hypothetical protein
VEALGCLAEAAAVHHAAAAAAEAEDVRSRGEVMKNQMTKLGEWVESHKRLVNAMGIATYAVAFVIFATALSFSQGRASMPKDQKWFASPQDAAEALVTASEKSDDAAFKEILGPNSLDLVRTGEDAVDKESLSQFISMAREKMTISYDPKNRSKAIVLIGNDNWPFAIPIAKVGLKWFFDTDAGRKELLYRRIGRNELDAIQVCRGFVEAQHEYALSKHDGSQVNQYAQRIISTKGKQDGLAWQNDDGSWGGTVGEKAATAIQQSYTGQPGPFHGYLFKVLEGQGPAAPLGAISYKIDGAMIGGFALLAYPAVYQGSGVKTFMVSQDGVVWEKDLGPNTLQVASATELFNPDKTWKPVFDDR